MTVTATNPKENVVDESAADPQATDPQSVPVPDEHKQKRGFSAMSPEKQSEIARLGGKAAHVKGTAYKFTPEEAKIAGKKGAIARARNLREKQAADEAAAATAPAATATTTTATKTKG